MQSHGEEYERVLTDEPLRKYLYEHHITADNYPRHEAELRGLFPSAEAWKSFVRQYLTSTALLSYHEFLNDGQRWDLFPHPRYIQQDFHMHDFFEMKYQLAGSGTVFVDSHTLFLRKSDICIIAPYVPHRNEVYSDDASMVNLVIPAEFLPQLFPRLMGFPNGFRDFFGVASDGEPTNRRWLHLDTGGDEQIRQIVANALACFMEGGQRSRLRSLCLEADLERLFLIVLALQPNFQREDSAAGTRDRMMAQIVDYIQGHLQEASLADVAALLHFSPAYASRLIKRQTGFSFQMLLLTMRLEAAARQLRQTDLSVDQIAANVGLTGKTNFYEKFRSIYGVNPGAFRSQKS